MRRYSFFIAHIAFLTLIVGVFFYQLLLGKLPVPTDALVGLYHPWRDLYAKEYPRGVPYKNFLITDPVRQQIPWRKIAIDAWKQGRVPWWNPYTYGGTPLVGNIQAAVFYPLNILFFVFSFATAWTILIVLQPYLAGLFLFLYLGSRKVHPTAALVGAVAWSFSGFSVAWLMWGTIVQTAMWLPLILLAIDRILEGKRRWWIILTGALTMQFLAGHAQVFLYGMIFSFFYFLLRLRQLPKHRTIPYVDFAKAISFFVVVTMLQWVPLMKSLLASARLTESVWDKPGFFIPWEHLIQFFVPDFFGNPATMNYWGTWNWAEFVGYVGIVPIFFAAIATTSNWKQARFWAWTILVGLLFALPTPVAKLPYYLHLPVASSLQPTRLLVIIDLSLAVLAAFGIEAFLKKPRRVGLVCVAIGAIIGVAWVATWPGGEHMTVARRNLLMPTGLFILAAVVVYIGIGFRKLQKPALLVLLGLSSFDLLRFGWKFTPFTPREYFFPETAVITYLTNQPKPFRVMSVDDRIFPPNATSYFGIETIEGYDPVYSARYEQFFVALARGNADITGPYGFNRILTTKNIDSPLLPYGNVRYLLSLEDLDRPFLSKVFQEGETRVYEYKKALPRAYFADRILLALSPKDTLERLIADPEVRLAVAEKPLDILSVPLTVNEEVRIDSYAANRMTLTATAANPRLLVILNQFDSGWHAKIDGTKAPLYRVNVVFIGILVPGGTHKIILQSTL